MPRAAQQKPKKILLVDGYNVIRAGSLYKHLTEQTPDHSQDVFNAAREALLSDVAGFAGRDYKATVVFDGAGNPGSEGERRSFGTIKYLFSPYGVSADTIIEDLANKAAKRGMEVLVVTSDANLQWTVFGGKVTRMSAAGFVDEVLTQRESFEEDASAGLAPTARKFTLGSRINPEVAARLERIARGKSS